MKREYTQKITTAINFFWNTKKKQGSVLAGKQLDAFLNLLKGVAMEEGVPESCIYLKNNHIPGYYRATKDWDMVIVSPQNNLVAAIELKSQVGSYGNNLNNRVEETLKVKVNEPHFMVRPEFKDTTYLDRYRILCQRLVLEHKYNAVALLATQGKSHYESIADNISIETFINSFRGHLLGLTDEFK